MSEPFRELLMFQVGARTFVSPVADVLRIGNLDDVSLGELVERTSLGPTFARERGLVVATAEGTESVLVVDQVLGIRSVPESEIRPLPAFAAAVIPSAAVAGLVLLDETATLLVDLPTLIRERLAAGPDHAPPPAATA